MPKGQQLPSEGMETTKTEGWEWGEIKKKEVQQQGQSGWNERDKKRSKIHVIWFLEEEKQNNEPELFFETII